MDCDYCEEPILSGEPTLAYANRPDEPLHRDCFLRQIIGSVGHQLGLCNCPGRMRCMEDPEDWTKRGAARLAVLFQDPLSRPRVLRAIWPHAAKKARWN
jgi:hypothetical protein